MHPVGNKIDHDLYVFGISELYVFLRVACLRSFKTHNQCECRFYVMQRDTTGLTAENKELKLRLQAMEQQAHLSEGMHKVVFYSFSFSFITFY